MQRYNDMYPGIRKWKRQFENECYANELPDGRIYTTTPYGRIQPVPPDLIYKLVNYLIQGTGADVLKHKIAELGAAGFSDYMIMPVHDEIVFDVPADLADDVLHDAMDIMTARNFQVPLTVDGKIVDRWGEPYRKEGNEHELHHRH